MWFARTPAPRSRAADTRYRTARYVAAARCENATFLLNKKTGRYYKLDDVGTELWELLRRSPDLDAHEILSALSEIYEVDSASISADVTALIARLIGYDVIEAGSEMTRPC